MKKGFRGSRGITAAAALLVIVLRVGVVDIGGLRVAPSLFR